MKLRVEGAEVGASPVTVQGAITESVQHVPTAKAEVHAHTVPLAGDGVCACVHSQCKQPQCYTNPFLDHNAPEIWQVMHSRASCAKAGFRGLPRVKTCATAVPSSRRPAGVFSDCKYACATCTQQHLGLRLPGWQVRKTLHSLS